MPASKFRIRHILRRTFLDCFDALEKITHLGHNMSTNGIDFFRVLFSEWLAENITDEKLCSVACGMRYLLRT